MKANPNVMLNVSNWGFALQSCNFDQSLTIMAASRSRLVRETCRILNPSHIFLENKQ